MKNKIYAVLLSLMILTGCNSEEVETKNGLEFVEANVVLDDNSTFAIPLGAFKPILAGDNFTYRTSDGEQIGQWEFSTDQSKLLVSFENQSIEIPVNSKSATQIELVMQSIDLTVSLLPIEESSLILINQRLLSKNSSWSDFSNNATRADIIFTYNY